MTNSFQNKNALLVGNGVSLLDSSQSVSWIGLLNSLKDRFNIDIEIDNEFKPFPLGFEEMLYLKGGSNSIEDKLKNLKQEIKLIIDEQLEGKRGFNDYHKKVAGLGYNDILTTNYDYAFELSLNSHFNDGKMIFAMNKSEFKYSLRRAYKLLNSNVKIWHIHGELYDSRIIGPNSKYYHEESIMIGYEHYAGYLVKIQEAINGKKRTNRNEIPSLNTRIKNSATKNFWIDALFTHNVDIVGLGLDFSENHLWWLLNYRASAIRKVESQEEKEILINFNNEIRFYYPDKEDDYTIKVNEKNALQNLIKKVNIFNKSKAIADVLKSFKVIPKPIKCNSYEDFYDKFIKMKRIELNSSGNLYHIN